MSLRQPRSKHLHKLGLTLVRLPAINLATKEIPHLKDTSNSLHQRRQNIAASHTEFAEALERELTSSTCHTDRKLNIAEMRNTTDIASFIALP